MVVGEQQTNTNQRVLKGRLDAFPWLFKNNEQQRRGNKIRPTSEPKRNGQQAQ